MSKKTFCIRSLSQWVKHVFHLFFFGGGTVAISQSIFFYRARPFKEWLTLLTQHAASADCHFRWPHLFVDFPYVSKILVDSSSSERSHQPIRGDSYLCICKSQIEFRFKMPREKAREFAQKSSFNTFQTASYALRCGDLPLVSIGF